MSVTTVTKEKTRLQLSRVLSYDQETLFSAWTEPDQLEQWIAPGAMTVPIAETDLTEGGLYRIQMKSADANLYTVRGEYQSVKRPKQLVMTWKWDHQKGPETLVTVQFNKVDNGTELAIIHEGFKDEDAVQTHIESWEESLENLDTYLEKSKVLS